MRALLLSGFTLMLACLVTFPLSAQDDAKKKKKRPSPVARLFQVPKDVELTDEQKTKVAALVKEYGPKLSELQKKQASILTDEQRQARAAAGKKAREDGKKGKELREAVDAAVTLTDEQKKQTQDVRKELGKLMREARGKFTDLLTDEQKAKLKTPRKKKAKKADN